ncbi:amidophosphoribosyltransferase [Thalassococcus sp. BH17M4-6]|uniref:amidophosphoribosyltransferase n=1 Tax=Thalassococcus sp. BH17M4-6 TaxID=3413148 RepID=UPI003BCBFF12
MAETPDTTDTPAIVAENATRETDANLDALILLGTFGPQDNLTALLRLSNGKIAKVSRGDEIGGDTVIAIDEGRLALAQNGTAHWLAMP